MSSPLTFVPHGTVLSTPCSPQPSHSVLKTFSRSVVSRQETLTYKRELGLLVLSFFYIRFIRATFPLLYPHHPTDSQSSLLTPALAFPTRTAMCSICEQPIPLPGSRRLVFSLFWRVAGAGERLLNFIIFSQLISPTFLASAGF